MKPDLSVQIGSLRLKNPVMAASGTFGYGKEVERFTDVKKLGAIVAKTLERGFQIDGLLRRLHNLNRQR